METKVLITGVVISGFFLILLSLAASLYSLISGRGSDKTTVNRLTIRVSLAVLVLACILCAVYFGIITPNPYVL